VETPDLIDEDGAAAFVSGGDAFQLRGRLKTPFNLSTLTPLLRAFLRQTPTSQNGSLSELFCFSLFKITTTTMINTFLTDKSAPTVSICLAIALTFLLD
jgi:hypothetical protein